MGKLGEPGQNLARTSQQRALLKKWILRALAVLIIVAQPSNHIETPDQLYTSQSHFQTSNQTHNFVAPLFVVIRFSLSSQSQLPYYPERGGQSNLEHFSLNANNHAFPDQYRAVDIRSPSSAFLPLPPVEIHPEA